MISEKDMEIAIVQNPRKYMEEEGLKLIAQQFRIGRYIFDILFEDRHGSKLIVELQRGTLDRNHTYKILDYYDEFKEKNPSEFIELFVIANKIPKERQKRLRSWGISFKEIPESEFIKDKIKKKNELNKPNIKSTNDVTAESPNVDKEIMQAYLLFKNQKDKFIQELLKIDRNVNIILDWKNLKESNIKNRKNWKIFFSPSIWGKSKNKIGIHFTFAYHHDKAMLQDYLRIYVSVQKPLKNEFHDSFKSDVVEKLKSNIDKYQNVELWPNAGIRKGSKLLETKLIQLNDYSYKNAIGYYLNLTEFITIVSETIQKYHNENRFLTELSF